ncbi:sugar ABC transporter ATP-binding protein [Aggregatilinea lenta]|uniref:sugar ABC transporter ATP-binding protein n=1 Tax=Aggregatilinea lenta TaxID=913108 RepID=UPI000E5B172C|nr:sugar ABC transporter ATP-binding protein [Aggregatilinea lenta]
MAASQPLLHMEQIDKHYPGVHALDHVDFTLHAGEVHVLLGENGAGKSTLMKVLSGSVPRDGGRIIINGEDVKHYDPNAAHLLGVGMVYQEFSLVPTLTVAENIFLGDLPRNRLGVVKWSEVNQKAQASLDDLGVDINPRAVVETLSVAEQQLTEIARIVTRQSRILLLDEPTSALSETERERLFDIIRRLQQRGVGIIYISHRLEEVPLIGTRVTIMRDGRVIDTLPIDKADRETMVSMMVGRQLTDQFPKTEIKRGDVVLRVENLALDGKLHDLSFELHRGEILGIFGLMGAGQTELAHALFGLVKPATGRISIDGKQVSIHEPVEAIREGMGFMLRDRKASLVPMQPIPSNITLANVSQNRMLRALNLGQETKTAEEYVKELQIRPPMLDRPVMFLSGGNQQKVCLARWLCSQAQILIVDEPTRGIDVGAKAEVFALLDRLAREGVGVIMISSEMPEILAMADRTLVMRDGHFTAEFERGEATQELLLHSAS